MTLPPVSVLPASMVTFPVLPLAIEAVSAAVTFALRRTDPLVTVSVPMEARVTLPPLKIVLLTVTVPPKEPIPISPVAVKLPFTLT